MLYLSTDDQSLGSVVYNSSQLLLFHTLTNLTAATQYFIRLAVGSRIKLFNLYSQAAFELSLVIFSTEKRLFEFEDKFLTDFRLR